VDAPPARIMTDVLRKKTARPLTEDRDDEGYFKKQRDAMDKAKAAYL